MDPNEALKECRELADEIELADTLRGEAIKGVQLAESFKALDEWLSREGFAPEAWTKATA